MDENIIAKRLEQVLAKYSEVPERLATIEERLANAIILLENFNTHIVGQQKQNQQMFVTQAEFSPVKKIVYGMMAFVGITVLSAILTTVLSPLFHSH